MCLVVCTGDSKHQLKMFFYKFLWPCYYVADVIHSISWIKILIQLVIKIHPCHPCKQIAISVTLLLCYWCYKHSISSIKILIPLLIKIHPCQIDCRTKVALYIIVKEDQKETTYLHTLGEYTLTESYPFYKEFERVKISHKNWHFSILMMPVVKVIN